MRNIARQSVALASNLVTLRAFAIEDSDAVTEALQDREIHRWTATISFTYTEQHFASWIQKHDHWWNQSRAAHFAVVDNSSGEVAGAIGLDFIDWEAKSGRPGYWIAPWARRKGFATSVVTLLKAWAFDELELEVLHLVTMLENEASARVASNAGFTFMGAVGPHQMTGLHDDKGQLNLWIAERDPAIQPVESRPHQTITIRPSIAEDFDQCLSLYESVAAEGKWIGGEIPVDRERRRNSFERSLASDDAASFLAEFEDRLIGNLGIESHRGIAEIGMMVRADWRGRGVGTRLMDTALVWAKEHNSHKITLEVWPHNTAALALYRKFGFFEEGLHRRHYRRRNGELWDAIEMGLILDWASPGSSVDSEQLNSKIQRCR